ncbi:hypothetical protein [Enterobacter asburiae]|uniref:hypothetical protein n=1 Tax=Enterobacter asburiae TaxID=61645 RepID=UPI001936A70F|nr:hypothetical protein [Enterobacter asburiae]QQE37189.1 hypothetical protein I6I13_12215 [Enterobacter asburiae]
MGIQSTATENGEQTLTITSVCGYDGYCRTIETLAGYALINVARKPEVGDTVLVSFCGSLDFAKVLGKALITQDGEAIEGDALDDATVMGVVTHLLNRVTDTDNRPVI